MADGSVIIEIGAEDSGAKQKLEEVGQAAKETADGFSDVGNSADEADGKLTAAASSADKAGKSVNAVGGSAAKTTNELKSLGSSAGDAANELESIDSTAANGIDEVGDSADQTSDELENLEDSAKGAGGGLKDADGAAQLFAAGGLALLTGALASAVSSLMSLAESTREYREDMAKLETAFTTVGHSSETATAMYNRFYELLGESDRSVEAANHLAELTNRQKDLEQWSNIAAGVMAKFGDSLPIEGLTEAANESAKVGQVVGALADALNWAGRSEDEFNKSLEKCADSQERATYITKQLNDIYGEAGEAYNEMTAGAQSARGAVADLEATQAEAGAALEPLTEAWTRFKTEALQAIMPIIKKVGEAFSELLDWMDKNPEKAEILKAALLGLAAAFTVLTVAMAISSLINMVTAAFSTMATVISAHPIIWIVAAIAGLVVAFLSLLEDCEGVSTFFSGLWDNLTNGSSVVGTLISSFQGAGDGIKGAFSGIGEFFSGLWDNITNGSSVVGTIIAHFRNAGDGVKNAFSGIGEFFSGIWSNITGIFSGVGEFFGSMFSDASSSVQSAWSSITGFFSSIWSGISNAFSSTSSWFSSMFSSAASNVQSAWSGITNFFSSIWSGISGAFSSTSSWFGNTFSSASSSVQSAWSGMTGFFGSIWSSISGVFSGVGSYFGSVFGSAVSSIQGVFSTLAGFFSNLWSSITSIFSYAGSAIVTAVGDAVSSAINWVLSAAVSIINGFISALNGIVSVLNAIPGVEMSPIDKLNVPQLAKGGVLKKGQVGLLEGDGAEAVVPLEKNTEWITKVADQMSDEVDTSDAVGDVKRSVDIKTAQIGLDAGSSELGVSDVLRAMGTQTAGINSLSNEFRQGSANQTPVVIQLDKRELGRAVIDTGNMENARIGSKLSYGGAY